MLLGIGLGALERLGLGVGVRVTQLARMTVVDVGVYVERKLCVYVLMGYVLLMKFEMMANAKSCLRIYRVYMGYQILGYLAKGIVDLGWQRRLMGNHDIDRLTVVFTSYLTGWVDLSTYKRLSYRSVIAGYLLYRDYSIYGCRSLHPPIIPCYSIAY